MNGRFGPDAARDAMMHRHQQQRAPGSPRRESSVYGSGSDHHEGGQNQRCEGLDGPGQRFDGSPSDSHGYGGNASRNRPRTPSGAVTRDGDRGGSAPPLSSQKQQQRPHTPSQVGQQQRRPCTPQQQRARTPQSSKQNNKLPDGNKEADAVTEQPPMIVPQSPPSPPASKPSAHALAVSRMMEVNADMEYAYARLMMLEVEHERVKARLSVLEKLENESGGV